MSTVFTRIARYAHGIAGLREDDVILASFPRSGNTWLRFVLMNYIELKRGGTGEVGYKVVDETMPEFGVDDLRRAWPYGDLLPRFVKTHWRYRFTFRRCRTILLARDPRDVMVSYFEFERARATPRMRGSFGEFIRSRRFGLRAWFEHARSWLPRSPTVLRYEALRGDDIDGCEQLFRRIVPGHDTRLLRLAVERSRFDHMRKAESTSGHPGMEERFRSGAQFARAGKVRGWEAHFAPEDLALYRRILQAYPDVRARIELAE